jgi:hypothetical protein
MVVETSAADTPILYQPLSTRRNRYPTWVIIKSSPLPVVVQRADLGNDICAMLLSTRQAINIPNLLDNVAESLLPLPFSAAYHNVLNMLYSACFPESTVHLFDAHRKIALATVVDFLVSDEAYAMLEAVVLASSPYLQQH